MIDPVAIDLGAIKIRWYGLIMAFGFVLGLFMAKKLAKQRNISSEIIQDYFVYLMAGSIIGARLWAVLLNLKYYHSFYDVIALWNGGMAIHGGLFGAAIVSYFYCKKRNIDFYDIADIMVIPLALGLSFGRIGNFINQEFYGRLTDLPWGIHYDVVHGKRHPSQIYESIKNLIIFFILLNMYKIKNLKKGTIFWFFILLYSVFRFFVEFFKDMQTWFGLTYGQIISIPLAFLAIFMLYRIGKTSSRKQ